MARRKPSRLTKRKIDALKPGEIAYDCEPIGFCCRGQKTKKTFMLRVTVMRRQKWLVIGDLGSPWTLETARMEAQSLLWDIRRGADIERLRYGGRVDTPSIADLCDRFMKEHAIPNKRQRSAESDAQNIENHIKPLLGEMAVKDVNRTDIETFKHAVREGKTGQFAHRRRRKKHASTRVTGGPAAANTCLCILSKAFNLAEIWGWRAEHTNPIRLVSKYKIEPRQRFLSDYEMQTLGEVLQRCDDDGSEDPYATAAIRLLALTGARLSEILTLEWKFIDFGRGFAHLPVSKTGQKVLFLNTHALAILREIEPQAGNPYVIVGKVPGTRLVNLEKPWRRIRRLASLDDVRLHDLRHSFAAFAAGSGASLPFIGQLLGHKEPQTTQRYAHLAAKPVQAVNNQVGELIGSFLINPDHVR